MVTLRSSRELSTSDAFHPAGRRGLVLHATAAVAATATIAAVTCGGTMAMSYDETTLVRASANWTPSPEPIPGTTGRAIVAGAHTWRGAFGEVATVDAAALTSLLRGPLNTTPNRVWHRERPGRMQHRAPLPPSTLMVPSTLGPLVRHSAMGGPLSATMAFLGYSPGLVAPMAQPASPLIVVPLPEPLTLGVLGLAFARLYRRRLR